jgi:hypothetical protein
MSLVEVSLSLSLSLILMTGLLETLPWWQTKQELPLFVQSELETQYILTHWLDEEINALGQGASIAESALDQIIWDETYSDLTTSKFSFTFFGNKNDRHCGGHLLKADGIYIKSIESKADNNHAVYLECSIQTLSGKKQFQSSIASSMDAFQMRLLVIKDFKKETIAISNFKANQHQLVGLEWGWIRSYEPPIQKNSSANTSINLLNEKFDLKVLKNFSPNKKYHTYKHTYFLATQTLSSLDPSISDYF